MTHGTRAIFSYGDLIRLELDLDLCLALVTYLHDIFIIPSVVFAEFGLAAVSGVVSAADKAKRDSFDL